MYAKGLASVPILRRMVFVNLAINWAMACGIKEKETYKYIKKYYYRHRIEIIQPHWLKIYNGWKCIFITDRGTFNSNLFIGTVYFYCEDDDDLTEVWSIQHYDKTGITRDRSMQVFTKRHMHIES